MRIDPRCREVHAPPRRAPGRRTGSRSCRAVRRRAAAAAPGLTTAPESRCEPGCLPFSSDRHRRRRRAAPPPRARVLEQLAEPDRAREAGRPGADDQHADVDPLVVGIGRVGDELARRQRRREISWFDGHPLLRARTSSVSFGNDLVDVADDRQVRVLEDRRVRILVDRDDHVRRLHADLVLDGAGDAERDVELRRHRLACLADLRRVRVPAGVDDGAGGRDRAAERPGQLLDEREVLWRRRGRARRRRSHPRPRSTGLQTPRAPARASQRRARSPPAAARPSRPARFRRTRRAIERARTEQRDARRRRPPHLADDRVGERGLRAHEAAVARCHVGQLPVEAGVEPSRRGRRQRPRRGSTGRRRRSRSRRARRPARRRPHAAAAAACRGARRRPRRPCLAPYAPAPAARPSTPLPTTARDVATERRPP